MSGEMNTDPTSGDASNVLLEFVAGAIAGFAATIIGYPFDTVKVRYQNPEIKKHHHNSFVAVITIIREEGLDGLYKGIASPLWSGPLLNAVLFAVYGACLNLLLSNTHDTPTLVQVTIAGFSAGLVTALINTPAELIKTQQQNMEALSLVSSTVPSATVVTKRIYRQHGLRGLYRGFFACILRDGPGYACYFLPYEAIYRCIAQSRSVPTNGATTVPWWGLFIAAAVAGIVGWTVTFPFDVVKTRMQSSGLLDDDGPTPYRTTWSTIATSYREEGLLVFVAGLAPTLWRAVPMTIVTFAVHDLIISAVP